MRTSTPRLQTRKLLLRTFRFGGWWTGAGRGRGKGVPQCGAGCRRCRGLARRRWATRTAGTSRNSSSSAVPMSPPSPANSCLGRRKKGHGRSGPHPFSSLSKKEQTTPRTPPPGQECGLQATPLQQLRRKEPEMFFDPFLSRFWCLPRQVVYFRVFLFQNVGGRGGWNQ